MNRGKHVRSAVVYVVLILLLVWSFTAFRSAQQENFISYSQVRSYFLNEQVTAFQVEDNQTLVLQLEDGKVWYHRLADVELFYNDLGDVIDQQQADGTLKEFDIQPAYEMPLWLQITIPIVGTVVVVMVIWGVMAMRQQNAQGGQGGMSRFGKARTVQGDGTVKVTFADVAGADEEKAELQELVDFLRNPQKYIDLGARIPKGVLLVGPPGTGKTLLAKAVAGEAGVKFLSISGSDFVELYVGVGASRVRDLFDQAKKEAPAIVFIDEIDAVGRQRGAGLGGGHDEREQTLNQLLVEMDGFAANEGVIVLAATNRQDILDPALLRPGRFDRQVYVGRPDMKGREEILKVHARRKPLAEDVDLKEVSRETTGFTGADLENLMNEAALLAARKNQPFITLKDIQESVIKVIAGPEKKSRAQLEEDRRITAYHEAGHAVVSHALATQDPVHQITIVPRGQAAGMTINRPQEDKGHVSRQELCETLCTLLGGRAAEAHALGFVCTGAISDLQRASAIARDMVTKYGMSEKLGLVTFSSEHDEVFLGRSMAQAKPYSEETAALIDSEVKHLLDQAYEACQAILKRDSDKLELVARYLLAYETMDAATFQMVYDDPQALAQQIPTEEVENNG
ncbi:ATP-dependent zinc metalloprotease FtsH [Pseudoflavonifractor sp. SW1122]|uniref:ATP-dependent zinc metalloprotease FtsH n=1 Tax=Pseudoflavonifractor sp. SW1122 TaxID=2530044 RepID=UPI001FAC22D5|nr:ATP-dependent zinc metalloprotease FtsH [Pseudoflavonifractor sp. SW1122]